jgi:hypothetical protein
MSRVKDSADDAVRSRFLFSLVFRLSGQLFFGLLGLL